MRIFLITAMLLLISSAIWAVSVPPHVPAAAPEEFATLEPVKFRDILGANTLSAIPKSWKLISVSAGEKSNSNNMWFQDSDGSIFLLQGFTSQNKLFIHENIYKIPAK
jgi:hypothetical protein